MTRTGRSGTAFALIDLLVMIAIGAIVMGGAVGLAFLTNRAEPRPHTPFAMQVPRSWSVVAAILFALLLPIYGRGCIGGGDVKLLVAVAIGLPMMGVFELLTITALAGGILAMAHLVMRLLPSPSLAPADASVLRRVYAVERWRHLRHAPLPYGVAIACGGILSVLSKGY